MCFDQKKLMKSLLVLDDVVLKSAAYMSCEKENNQCFSETRNFIEVRWYASKFESLVSLCSF